MIIGYGIDLIDIRRVEKTINKFGKRFINRIFTKGEIIRSDNRNKRIDSYAKRFAAKESLAKSLGTGFRNNLNFKDIEILNDNKGKPYYFKTKKINNIINKRFKVKKYDLFLSISDEKNYSIAFTILQTQ